MNTKTIKQRVSFKAKPHAVYEALINSKKHAAFSGEKANISSKVGGKFFAYDGYITGKNLELVKDKKIVQMWHASDWEDERFSTVTFIITATTTGCSLSFTHQNVPADQYEQLKQGWIDFYWKPIKEMLEKKQ